MPSLKNLPGIKQLRGVKDKAVLKIVSELQQGLQEKQAIADRLRRNQDSLQSALDQMKQLVAEVEGTDDFEVIHRELIEGNDEYTKHVALHLAAQKELQEAVKKVARYRKLQEGFLKLASNDPTLQAALAQAS
jgi:hypothetical protein